MITVVTENDERSFNATMWTAADDKTLTISDGLKLVAEYAPGGWQYVIQADSEVPTPPRQ